MEVGHVGRHTHLLEFGIEHLETLPVVLGPERVAKVEWQRQDCHAGWWLGGKRSEERGDVVCRGYSDSQVT